MNIRVAFHGVRGSTPCHGDDTRRYGGNTSCVSLAVPGHRPILFDLGTGLRYFGLGWPADQPFIGTALLTHLHWDHTQGLPFFGPLLRPGAELDIYAPVQEDGRLVGDVVASMVHPPLFPIDIDQFAGTVRCHDVGDESFMIDDVKVTARLIPHVGNTLGYRVEWGGLTIVYMSDHQQPYDGSFTAAEGALELVQGADLLIHDAQYTDAEFAMKFNWGHCTVDYAVWLAMTGGVKRLALYHHDPMRSDADVDRLLCEASETASAVGMEVLAASEGLVLELS
jgi:phosphoribosyl 1,2-cyclic phosphodiesterase